MKLSRALLAIMMLLGILVASFCFCVQVEAQAGQVVLSPTDDTYINLDMVNSNYGFSTKLRVCLAHYWTWLKFELSSIPDGALGITAVLELCTTYNGVTSPHTVVACLILNNFNNSWSEDTLTSGNMPSYPDDVELDIDYVANDETWYEWAVTEAVVNAIANNATAVTILMRYPWGTDAPGVSFNSKEAGKKIPKLTIQWTDVVPPDTTPPVVSISSPQKHKIYGVTVIPLTFTLSETTSWIGYSLDGAANVTIINDTTLTSLLDGTHSVVVFANDTTGNMGSSDIVYFAVDTTPPNIEILSPENNTHTTSSIPLIFAFDETVSWVGYSLDGQTNTTITGNTTLTGLSDGTHNVVVHASDIAENTGSSDMVYFTIQTTPIDTTQPSISIVSPENKTYDTIDIPLTFTVDESVSWMAYSLDGQANVTIAENTFLNEVSDGSHSLIMYARDTAGNTGFSDIVYFTIQTTPMDTTLPIADAGQNQAASVGTLVTFDGSGSTDNVAIVSCEWDFGDGTTDTAITCNHTYAEPGNYTVTLTVMDAAGNLDTDSINVEVIEEALPLFPLWILGAVAVVIVLAVAATFFWKRRK